MRGTLILNSVAGLLAGLMSTSVSAGMVTSSLGNTSPGFADGSTPDILQRNAAWSVGPPPAPFDGEIGNELIGPSFSATWTHSYGAIVDPIISASITIGIWDHDSMASGSQLALFSVGGINLTADLDALFEASGGGSNEYNVYTLNFTLTPLLEAALANGTPDIVLNLQGPGLQDDLVNGGVTETNFNSAGLFFSTLSIETRDGSTNPVPEPSSMALMMLGGASLFGFVRRRRIGARPVA